MDGASVYQVWCVPVHRADCHGQSTSAQLEASGSTQVPDAEVVNVAKNAFPPVYKDRSVQAFACSEGSLQ